MKLIRVRYLGHYANSAIVDDWNYERLKKKKWSIVGINKNGNGGVIRETLHRDGKPMANHIMNDFKHIYDHINRQFLDCREENLRIATQQQNSYNRSMHKNNTTGLIGVYYHKKGKLWTAMIDGQYLGCFKTAEEAARKRDLCAEIYHGEFAVLNFPEKKDEK